MVIGWKQCLIIIIVLVRYGYTVGNAPTGLEDLHLQLADAMHDNGHTREALELLVALAQPGKVIDPVHAKTLCGRIGK